MSETKTTAQIANELNKDTTKFSLMDVSKSAVDSIEAQLQIAVKKGLEQFSDDLIAIVMMNKTDPRLSNVVKRIFFSTPFLPKPCPDQAVWVYNRKRDTLTFMWSLPEPYTCAALSGYNHVKKEWERSMLWSKLFFENKLIKHRRDETGIDMPTEKEFLYLNREKLSKMSVNHAD